MRALKHPTLLALLLSLLMGTGCQAQVLGEAQAASSDASSRRKVIIDTDTGADDAAALILAARCADIDILGVTVLVGNVDLEKGTQNALMALETAGSSAPVYKGASENYSGEPIQAFSVFGEDGMGDAGLIHPSGKAEDDVKSVSRCHGSCITDPGETFAQVIFYQEGFIYDVVSNDFDYNVTLITEVEKENYFNLFLSAIA